MDLTSPIALLGIALVVAGVLGGGAKLLGTEIPVIATLTRQVITALIGLALFVAAQVAHSEAEFRVESASVAWNRSASLRCAVDELYVGHVTVAGSEGGNVQYRFLVNGQPQTIQLLRVTRSGTYTVQGRYQERYSPELPPLAPLRLQLEVLSPNRLQSAAATLPVVRR